MQDLARANIGYLLSEANQLENFSFHDAAHLFAAAHPCSWPSLTCQKGHEEVITELVVFSKRVEYEQGFWSAAAGRIMGHEPCTRLRVLSVRFPGETGYTETFTRDDIIAAFEIRRQIALRRICICGGYKKLRSLSDNVTWERDYKQWAPAIEAWLDKAIDPYLALKTWVGNLHCAESDQSMIVSRGSDAIYHLLRDTLDLAIFSPLSYSEEMVAVLQNMERQVLLHVREIIPESRLHDTVKAVIGGRKDEVMREAFKREIAYLGTLGAAPPAYQNDGGSDKMWSGCRFPLYEIV